MTRPKHTPRRTIGRVLSRSAASFLAALLAFSGTPHAGAITRATVINRAESWVDAGVPYSQSSLYEGYRQDCSGFVSMSWALTGATGNPISPATDSLPGYAVPISKDRLLHGDMIVRPKTDTLWGHAVIFGGWADDERTTYWCYEQSNSAGGTRLRQTPYAYWPSSGEGFTPYRYKGITEDMARAARVSGPDRYATAVAAAVRAFPDPAAVDTVVLATGQAWPDALGAAGLAGAVGGPVLLTHGARLPDSVRDELVRLAPGRVLVIGGGEAVTDDVLHAVRAAGVSSVERIGGANRYETASLVARRAAAEVTASGGNFGRHVYVATGEQFADALAVSPVSAARARPVLLVSSKSVPETTTAALADLGVDRVTIVGGESAVSRTVRDELARPGVTVNRISGADRYATALAVADHGVAEGLSRNRTGIATGSSFPDALGAGPALGLSATPAVLYLTPSAGINRPVYNALRTHRAQIGTAVIFGGPSTLSDQVRAEATAALRGW